MKAFLPNMESEAAPNHAKEDDEKIYDHEALLERVDGELELLREIVNLFLEECPGMMEKIKLSIREKKSSGLQSSAHTLKGSVSYLGAQRTHEAAFALEKMGI